MTQRSLEADLELPSRPLSNVVPEHSALVLIRFSPKNRERLAARAAHYRIPALYSLRGYAKADGIVKLDSMSVGLRLNST